MPMVYRWLKFAQFRLLPPACMWCGQPGLPGLDLCSGCRGDLPLNQPACRRCALPLPASATGLCGRCLRAPPPFDRALALLRYQRPAPQWVQALKFGGRLEYARLLGELLADAVAAQLATTPDVIIPVPLHPARQRRRGFNQALELARPVARRLGVPIDTVHCRRLRATAAQAELGARQRRRNVRNAFAVDAALPARRVAIVDDVVTTGHTVGELARALRARGVTFIEVWSVARAAPPAS
jgi:ComF family protein